MKFSFSIFSHVFLHILSEAACEMVNSIAADYAEDILHDGKIMILFSQQPCVCVVKNMIFEKSFPRLNKNQ
jgi:hypothetical protein